MRLVARAALAGSILLFLPGLLEQFEAPKAALVRALGIAVLASLAFAGGQRPRFQWRALDLAVAGWLLVELVCTTFSVSPSLSFFGDTKQREGLLTSFGLAGVYWAARAGAASVRGTLTVGLAAATIAALYAALQATGLDWAAWAHIATYERAGPFMRPFGTLGHPNVLGVLTAAAAATAAALVFSAERRRWLWATLAALFLAVTAVTLSRGAWLGALAGVSVATFLTLRARGLAPRRVALWLGGAAAVLIAILVIAGFGPTLLRRLGELLHPESGSARSRLEIWRIAARAWQAHPWLGVGPDAFELMFQRYQTPEYWRFEWATVPAHAHSIYLHVLATRGVLGLAAGLAVLVAGGLAAWQAWRAGEKERGWIAGAIGSSLALLVAGAFGALGIAGATWLAVAGGSLMALGVKREVTPREQRRAPQTANAAGLAGAVAALLVAVLGVMQLLASRASFEALDWAPRGPGDGDPQRALSASSRGPALTPWDDQPQYYRAQTLLRIAASGAGAEPLDPAEAAARRAIRLEPLRALDYQSLASVELARARLGDPGALLRARQAFDRAGRLAPYNALLWLQLAEAEIALGRPQDALPRIRHALALYPDAAVARAMLERAQAAPRTVPPPG